MHPTSYAANSGDNNVSAYSINAASGALTPVAGSPFAAGSGPAAVALDPSGQNAYVPNFGDNTVSFYTVDFISGALTPFVLSASFAAGSHPTAVTVAPSGQFGYVVNQGDNTVSAYTLGGLPSPIAGPSYATGNGPFSVVVSP